MNVENIDRLIGILEGKEIVEYNNRIVFFNMKCHLNQNRCGTFACIAGHISILTNEKPSVDRDYRDIGKDWLEIDSHTANKLFYTWDSSSHFNDRELAIERLKTLRATGDIPKGDMIL